MEKLKDYNNNNNVEITSFKHNVRGNILKKHLNGLFGGVEFLNDMLNKNACVSSGHYSVYSVKSDNKELIIDYKINTTDLC